MRVSLALALAGLLVAACIPLVAGEFWMTLLTQIMIFGLLALSADLLLGHAGLFSLCHAAFFAVAAYTTGILHVRYGATTAVAAPAGILAGTLLSVVLASPLAMLAARNTTPNLAIYQGTRFLLNVIRAVPSLVWAIIFVASLGFGPIGEPGHLGVAVLMNHDHCAGRVDQGHAAHAIQHVLHDVGGHS